MNETNKLSFHFNLILLFILFFPFFEVQLVPRDDFDLSRIKINVEIK